MMNKLLNIMKMQSFATQGTTSHTRVGTISGYDPNNHAVKVVYQPDGNESGWLPLMSQWVGNGWGMFAAPNMGDMVHVNFMDGNFETGMVSGRAFNDEDRPLPTPSGEWWLVHKSGSLLKFLNDGTVSMQASTVNLTGNLHVTGNIVCDEDVSDKNGSMQEMRDDYNPHTHGGSPPPVPQMT